MKYYAHSPKNGFPAQSYAAHIHRVMRRAQEYAQKAGVSALDGALLTSLVDAAARYHDLGKLEKENQLVLSGQKSSRNLPYRHQDAGAAYLLSDKHFCLIAAAAVSAHHTGYTDFTEEYGRQERAFRDECACTADKTDTLLPMLEKIHSGFMDIEPPLVDSTPEGNLPVFLRMLMSCLADADHTDTAIHYGNHPDIENTVLLRPAERLAALDTYIQSLGGGTDRDVLRGELYCACRNANIVAAISSCDCPVGSGKTTAIMAHLLAQAQRRGLRRIFVVLPFTNIICQSVETYRKALVLPGENPQDVVAELHHRADFESEDVRHLSALWRAPIVVTTAVAFFEALASNKPSTLRRLHELPNSAIFVDESHAALPARLLPIAWQWMNIYAKEWGCYWVLASGSLCRFWKIPEIAQCETANHVPEIVDDDLRGRLGVYEQNRISYQSDLEPKSIHELIDWIAGFQGPRLVILNTVQSAAVLADAYSARFSREHTEHLSTALTPNDREKTLERVKKRLKNQSDTNWTLFATSCVEAGVNLSFRTGFREIGSLVSLLQAAGRVNREGTYDSAQIWTFVLAQDEMLKRNPGIKDAAEILRGYFKNGSPIVPALSTQSISSEIRLHGVSGIYKTLLKHERFRDFRRVENQFKVIDSDTRIAVVDPAMIERIRFGKIDWRELQMHAVQIAFHKLVEVHAEMIFDGIYRWDLPYNDFLGYMAGILQSKRFESGILII